MGKIKSLIMLILLLNSAGVCFGQELSKFKRVINFRRGVLTDSTSTLMIPVDVHEFASSKSVDVDYSYANMIFYDFKRDSSFNLFDRNTCIMHFQTYQSDLTWKQEKKKSILKNWILYRVKNNDYDKNGKIDSHDPDILYASDAHGVNLKQLTTQHENVVSIDVYHEQGFALVTLQHDTNKDNKYDKHDREYSYVKIDLAVLALGKRIESK